MALPEYVLSDHCCGASFFLGLLARRSGGELNVKAPPIASRWRSYGTVLVSHDALSMALRPTRRPHRTPEHASSEVADDNRWQWTNAHKRYSVSRHPRTVKRLSAGGGRSPLLRHGAVLMKGRGKGRRKDQCEGASPKCASKL